MKIVKAEAQLLGDMYGNPIDGERVLRKLESHGRVCYKSEGRIKDGSAEKFVSGIIKSKHSSVLEHVSISVKFICDRGISHEIVRHRIASFSQASTRYCNYSKDSFGGEITVIEPSYLVEGTDGYTIWQRACEEAEKSYFELLNFGFKAEEARAVLPHSLMTELDMTANLREWRHFLEMRGTAQAHPQIRELAQELLAKLQEAIPIVFDDITI